MDNRSDVREFLITRRARVSPAQAGLPVQGTNRRRVPGLRREEVALLAGLSVDYYTQIERGKLRGVSESVLDAIAGALELDDAERAHLCDLCRAANSSPRPVRHATPVVRPVVQRIVDAITDTPVFVRNRRLDILTANSLGHALYAPLYPDPHRPDPTRPPNLARFCFLDPRAIDFHRDWETAAAGNVELLRTEAGRDPYDRNLTDLIGELSTRSEPFRARWADHNVRLHRTGVKYFHHPVVGDLELPFESMELAADTGLTLVALSAEPASPSADALGLLASWVATNHSKQYAQDRIVDETSSRRPESS